MERELDDNVHQSFAVRKRVLQKMGNSDHLVIWFTDTDALGSQGQPIVRGDRGDGRVDGQYPRPTRRRASLPNRPAKAVDSCFDVNGKLMYSGPDVWDGIINDKPPRAPARGHSPCSALLSRTVAGAPLKAASNKCALKPVDTAVADGA